MRIILITGISGSGKSVALNSLEDAGYYCVDNLPVELIPRFAEIALQSGEIPRTALVVDVREGAQLEKLPAILKSVKRLIPTRVIFLEATDPVLLRRFSETRRPHPLGHDRPVLHPDVRSTVGPGVLRPLIDAPGPGCRDCRARRGRRSPTI